MCPAFGVIFGIKAGIIAGIGMFTASKFVK
jgi:hypothetical protein